MKRSWILVALAAAAPYVSTLDDGFHYDDEHALVRNTHLRSLDHVPSFFVDSSTFSAEPGMAMYRPLLQTTFALNYAWGGLDGRGWHLVNVLLHVLASVGAYFLFRHLAAGRPSGAGVALASGLFFALHPVHVQAVSYLSSRSEVLCMGLVLWGLYFSVARLRAGAGSALQAGALLSKSAGIVFLPLVALLEARRRSAERRWWRLLPAVAISAGYLALIWADGFLPRSLAQNVRPVSEQLATQLKVLVFYLRLAAMPVGLSIEHGLTVAVSWTAPVVLGALLFLLSLGGVALTGGLRRVLLRPASLGVLWFALGLAVTAIVPLNLLVNEHRLYLPMFGFILAACTCLKVGGRSWNRKLVIASCILLGVLSWKQSRLWANELTLWTYAAKTAPGSYRAWANLGLARHQQEDRDGARLAYQRALALNPDHARARNNLGLLLEEEGDWPAAEAAYTAAANASASFSGPLANLGRLQIARGNLFAASRALKLALERNPGDLDALIHSGRLAEIRGDLTAARASYEQVLAVDPESAAAANNLGLLQLAAGDEEAAEGWFSRAIESSSNHEEARANLLLMHLRRDGVPSVEAYRQLLLEFPNLTQRGELTRALARRLVQQDRLQEAEGVYRDALEAGAVYPGLHRGLAEVLQGLGRSDEALRQFREAAGRAPQDAELHNALAAAAAALGRLGEARQATVRALEIDPDNDRARVNLERLGYRTGAPVEDP